MKAGHLRRRAWPRTRSVVGASAAVVVVAFAGGALSGRLADQPAGAGRSTAPPATPVAVLEADVVRDLTLDLQARAAGAASPQAQLARHLAVAHAWAPDRAPEVEAGYARDAIVTASDPTSASITGGEFVVAEWATETITATTATVTLVGHYRLDEPGNRLAAGGVVDQADETWHLSLAEIDRTWLLETRRATPLPG